MPIKRLIDARRMRKSPSRGFGWIDHRLLRNGYLERCSPQALALYLLLLCASDAQGLSYYSDRRAAQLLSLELAALSHARGELIRLGLIVYQAALSTLEPGRGSHPPRVPTSTAATGRLRTSIGAGQ